MVQHPRNMSVLPVRMENNRVEKTTNFEDILNFEEFCAKTKDKVIAD
jgi:hypothetical protein